MLEMTLRWVQKCGRKIHCGTKQKSLKKGPMWRGSYEVEGKTPAGNYLLKGVKGKGKGKVRNTAIPPNQLKRYIARSQNIPAKSDDKYASESDEDDDEGPPIGTNSPVSSDADTILYADPEDDKGIPGHSSGVLIPGHTSSSAVTVFTYSVFCVDFTLED